MSAASDLSWLIGRECLYLEKGLALYSRVQNVSRYDIDDPDTPVGFEVEMTEIPNSDFNDLATTDREPRTLTVNHGTWLYSKGETTTSGYITFTIVYGRTLLSEIKDQYRQIESPDRMTLYRTARRVIGWPDKIFQEFQPD